MSRKPDPPIVEGELIPGTHLRRRFQGGRELCPRYVGPELGLGERLVAADLECARLGIRMYIDGCDTYWQIDGTWCLAFVGDELNYGRRDKGNRTS